MSYAHAITQRRGYAKGRCPEILDSPYFQNDWERNTYRVFRLLKYEVSYAPPKLDFKTPYRGKIAYRPDFWIRTASALTGRFVEVKGYLDGPSKTKLLGFKKHYPEDAPRLLIITKPSNVPWFRKHFPENEIWIYGDMARQFRTLVPWGKREIKPPKDPRPAPQTTEAKK